MEFLWTAVIIEAIIIVLLLIKPKKIITVEKPQIIVRDWNDEERTKIELYRNEEMLKISRTLSEEKENSLIRIQQAELQAINDINERKSAELSSISSLIENEKLKKENELQAFISTQEELKNFKIEELNSSLDKIVEENKISAITAEEEIAQIKKGIEEWRTKYSAAIEGYKNLEKIKEAENYYKISFSSEEFEELAELNKAIKHLKNPMPFRKAVHEIYYKNKVNALVLRVVGSERISGIYKITHIESGKCYVGQSVDIGERWKQHVKRGVGAEPLTNNKLYPAMMELGIENFTFEIVERTTDTSKLNEMEKYWQEFYQAKDFGYSIK